MNFYKYIYILILPFALLSCEKDVILDLNSIEPKLVIDAQLAHMGPCKVKLTMTQDYWDQSEPKTISGAKITISNKAGNKDILIEMPESGLYLSQMMGVTDEIYTLSVEVDGKVYTATEHLPRPVPINSISTYAIDTGDEVYFYPQITITDPKDEENFYYFMLTINNNRMQQVNFTDDKYINGLIDKEILFFFDDEENGDEELKVGDRITIEMQSISKGAYNFYNTLSSPGSSQSSNPISNFSGDVLGMFKTYSTSYKEMTITENDLQQK